MMRASALRPIRSDANRKRASLERMPSRSARVERTQSLRRELSCHRARCTNGTLIRASVRRSNVASFPRRDHANHAARARTNHRRHSSLDDFKHRNAAVNAPTRIGHMGRSGSNDEFRFHDLFSFLPHPLTLYSALRMPSLDTADGVLTPIAIALTVGQATSLLLSPKVWRGAIPRRQRKLECT